MPSVELASVRFCLLVTWRHFSDPTSISLSGYPCIVQLGKRLALCMLDFKSERETLRYSNHVRAISFYAFTDRSLWEQNWIIFAHDSSFGFFLLCGSLFLANSLNLLVYLLYLLYLNDRKGYKFQCLTAIKED